MGRKIQAVFFDMGGTIETYNYTHQLRLKATAILQQKLQEAGISLSLSVEQLLDVITTGLAQYKRYSLETLDELPPYRVWGDFVFADYELERAKLAEISEDLSFFVETHFYHRTMRPEMPAVLEALRQMGLKIGLISNINSRGQVAANLQEYGIIHYFNPLVLSSEFGRRKPDPAIFHYAARLANVPASACAYVGDRVIRDIDGARRAGYGLAIQIKHDFEHGENDAGQMPDAVIENMTELLPILQSAQNAGPLPAEKGQISALIFDAGDILYFRPERGAKFAAFLKELGLEIEANHRQQKKAIEYKAYRGEINHDEYRAAVVGIYGITDPEQLKRGKQALIDDDANVEFFPGVPETLLALKKQGYLLGIITDTANSISAKLSWFERGGFGHVWDAIISSMEIGARKPDPTLYHAALNQLGLTADQALFIGHRTSELDGAHAVGIKTVAFNYDPDAHADFYIENFADLLQVPEILNRTPENASLAAWDISMSTMWAKQPPPDLPGMLARLPGLDICRVELNHQINSAILAKTDFGGLVIGSIHEPCPADIPVHTLKVQDWMISAIDEEKRQAGVAAVKRSLDLAGALEVKTIVVHPGNVGCAWEIEKQLYQMFRSGGQATPAYLELKSRLVKERAALAGPRLEAAQKSLLELLEYARPLGVCLGLENRYHFLEIPLPDELALLLELSTPERLGFWYDVGHAHVLDSLGLCQEEQWIERFASRIVGVHLHDAQGINDHLPPGTGEIDFKRLSSRLPASALRTIEVHASHSAEQVKASLLFLAQTRCIRRLAVNPQELPAPVTP